MSSCELKHISGHIRDATVSRLIKVPANTVYKGVVLCDIPKVFTHARSKTPLGLSYIHFVAYFAFDAINEIIAFAITITNSGVGRIGQCT